MLPGNDIFLKVLSQAMRQDSGSGSCQPLVPGVNLALEELLFRETRGSGHQKVVLDGLRELVREYNGLASVCPDSQGQVLPPVEFPHVSDTASFDQQVRCVDVVRGELLVQATRLTALLENKPSLDIAWRQRVCDFLLNLARNEADEIARDYNSPELASSPLRPDDSQSRLQAVMRERMNLPDLEVTGLRQLSGGFSRETMLVSAQVQGAEARFVIRAGAMGGGYLDGLYRAVEDEFPVLRFAHEQGVPVPQVYFVETDQAVIGSSFILMEHCAGATIGDVLHASGAVDVGLFRALAEVMARIHGLPWQQSGVAFSIDDPARQFTVSDGIRSMLKRNRLWWESANLRPSVSLTLAYDWLVRNVPDNQQPARVIHGDIGFHNMMVDGDKVQAVLDWEAAGLGSPAWDLVAVEGMLGSEVSWREFSGWYVEAGGELPSEEELAYHRMLRTLSGNLTCATALEKWFEKKCRADFLVLGLGARSFFQQGFIASAEQLWKNGR